MKDLPVLKSLVLLTVSFCCFSLSCSTPIDETSDAKGASGNTGEDNMNDSTPGQPLRLWYNKPAFANGLKTIERPWEIKKAKYNKSNPDQAWERYGLPVGNGSLGAVTYGGISKERIQFNNDTIWSGGPGSKDYTTNIVKGSYKYLPEIRRLLLEGKKKEAQKLSQKHLTSKSAFPPPYPDDFGSYQTWGEFYLEFPIDEANVTDYTRDLNISNATSSVQFALNGVKHQREIFASYPDKCIVMRLSAEENGLQSLKLSAATPHNTSSSAEGNVLIYTSTQKENGLRIETRVGVINEGGTLDVTDSHIDVKNADAITLIITSATDYAPTPPNYRSGVAPSEVCAPQLTAAMQKGYAALRKDHIKDYSSIFGRVSLNIEQAKKPAIESLDPRTTKNAALVELWKLGGGTLTDEFLNNTSKNLPDEAKIIQELTYKSQGDSYATKCSTIIIPPTTGEYTFWIASDDSSLLQLSSDENESNLTDIASLTHWVKENDWDKAPTQKSKPIQLVAGKKYYLRAFHKEGGGGDHLGVAWAGPSIKRSILSAKYLELPKLNDQTLSIIDKTNNPILNELPTDVRLAKAQSALDIELETLYIQYGRYLLIASSRPGSLPANLQGVWANLTFNPWGADYHLNINLQMNYWPAEMGALAECALPLVDYIEQLSLAGTETAQEYAGTKGWTAHLHSNIWGFTAPSSSKTMFWAYFPLAGSWLCQHIWDHYDYTRDVTFLREQGYPIMKGNAEFVLGYLSPNNDGKLVCSPSWSPEHGPISAGCTADQAMAWDILNNTAEAAQILGDTAMQKRCEEARDNLAPYKIGRYGQLQEWPTDIDNPKSRHRHTNHLYGLHPGRQISVVGTPELAEACRVTLNARGDVSTGWSMGWKVNFWARLHNGDRAHKLLTNLLKRGTLPNLWDNHAPFQIDGNFGGTSGAIEMLLQSSASTKEAGQIVHLLPALPTAWATGEVKGLRARGAFEVDIKWQTGKLISAKVLSHAGGQLSLHYEGKTITMPTTKGEVYKFNNLLEMQ